jgi:hypothetical protein
LHDSIISQRGHIWAHKISLTPPRVIEMPTPIQESDRSCIFTPPHFIEMPTPIQESDRSCIYVLGVSDFSNSTIFIVDFSIIRTVLSVFFFIFINLHRWHI